MGDTREVIIALSCANDDLTGKDGYIPDEAMLRAGDRVRIGVARAKLLHDRGWAYYPDELEQPQNRATKRKLRALYDRNIAIRREYNRNDPSEFMPWPDSEPDAKPKKRKPAVFEPEPEPAAELADFEPDSTEAEPKAETAVDAPGKSVE